MVAASAAVALLAGPGAGPAAGTAGTTAATAAAVGTAPVGTAPVGTAPVGTATAPPDDELVVDEVPVEVADVPAALALSVPAPTPRTAPALPDVLAADDAAADLAVSDLVVSDAVAVDGYTTLGVTWSLDAAPDEVDVRVRTRTDGAWSAWVPLESDGVTPDPGTAEAARDLRAGTESVWIGAAEDVQLAFGDGGAEASDVRLALVGPQEAVQAAAGGAFDDASTDPAPGDDATAEPAPSDPAPGAPATTDPAATDPATTDPETRDATAGDRAGATASRSAVARTAALTGSVAPAAVAPAAGVVAAGVAAPGVISRAAWGAAPQQCAPDVASTLLASVVHHTAGPNSYGSVEEAKAQIRADQRYHQQSRGWCDIGYNFLVDKWGNVYEGRAGSGSQPVIGVHAGGFNTATLGVSMLGDYSSTTPSAAVRESVARVIAWRLGQYHRDPMSTISYTTLGGENSRFSGGTTLALPVVVGHRDVAYTACPGNGGYGVLGAIKQRAKEMIGGTLVNPRLSTQQVAYGSGLQVVAGVSYGLAWNLTITDVRSGVDVVRRSGSTGPSTGSAVIGWDGRTDAGVPLGTGDYRLTVTGHDLVTGQAMAPWAAGFAVTGSQDPPTVAPVALAGSLRFVPVTPARLLDTRPSGASLGPASRVDVTVTGRAGIPADARAVAINVTSVHSSGTTHVRAWPAGAAVPNASVTNTDPSRTSAAATIVGVGGEGKVSLWNSTGSTHLLVDVTGYFVEGGTGSGFAAAAPARLLETRTAGGAIPGGTRRTLQVAGRAGVPADATAVVLNVTSTASGQGYVSVVPRGAPAGVVSTVNHHPQRDVANRAVVPLAGGAVDVDVAGAGAQVVVDVVGWFSPSAPARFTPVVPVRAFDTRTSTPLGAATDRRFDLAGAGVPSDARAVALSLTATQPSSFATYLTVWGAGPRPGTSDLNTGTGRDQANLAVVAPSGGGVRVYNDQGSTHVVGDVLGWFR